MVVFPQPQGPIITTTNGFTALSRFYSHRHLIGHRCDLGHPAFALFKGLFCGLGLNFSSFGPFRIVKQRDKLTVSRNGRLMAVHIRW